MQFDYKGFMISLFWLYQAMEQKLALLYLYFLPQNLEQIQTLLCKVVLDIRKKPAVSSLSEWGLLFPKPGEVPFHRL